jgi:hypothetical protein
MFTVSIPADFVQKVLTTDSQMLLNVLDQMPPPLARMVARTFILDLPQGPLDWLFIMHLQCVGSHNHSAASGLRLRTV